MSPLAPAIGLRFHLKVLLHKPSTENTIKSINQAWLEIFYYKVIVIAVNIVIHYKYLNLKSKKIPDFFPLPEVTKVASNVK